MDDLAECYLDEHGCLDLHDVSKKKAPGVQSSTKNQEISSSARNSQP
jgi:hypothetical protein